MFELEPGLMIWTIISFIILLVLLAKFAYKPLLSFMEQREQGIRKAIEESEQTRRAAEDLLSQYKKQLEDARGEARKIIDEGSTLGERLKKDIMAKAAEESKVLIGKAQEEIEREKQKALVDLQKHVANFSLEIASKIIQNSLTPDDHMRLIEESLTRIREGHVKN